MPSVPVDGIDRALDGTDLSLLGMHRAVSQRQLDAALAWVLRRRASDRA